MDWPGEHSISLTETKTKQNNEIQRKLTAFPLPLLSLLITAFLPSTSLFLACLPSFHTCSIQLLIHTSCLWRQVMAQDSVAQSPHCSCILPLQLASFASGLGSFPFRLTWEGQGFIQEKHQCIYSLCPKCEALSCVWRTCVPPATCSPPPVPAPLTPQYYVRLSWGHRPQRLPGFQLLKGIFYPKATVFLFQLNLLPLFFKLTVGNQCD